ncbi:hypothetical protein B0T16DRAFT_511323 [Cercophora newfieldiana]|uniref:Uncharacterized protein n=1 Tax=Cercophora newfieldiana TaxID=92897 RepID=A0AA40CPS1_9PEZI|nr:hypothetical protein B0T16DRAFT_511323 [Cercophora newfieldiana]
MLSALPLSAALPLFLLLPLTSAQQARCQYYPLRNFADLFIEAQTFGELDPSFLFSPNYTFLQNGKPTTPAASTLSTPLPIDLEITLIDQANCAVYTELIIADAKSPRVIGAQIQFAAEESDAGGVALQATRVEIVKASASVPVPGISTNWQFNASAALGHVRGEDWEAIAQTERTAREGLVGAAEAFLEWVGEGRAVDGVPFGVPCSRLEGEWRGGS